MLARRVIGLLLISLSFACIAFGGESLTLTTPAPQTDENAVPLWKLDIDTSYTFRSGFHDVEGYGKQAEAHYSVDAGYRFKLADKWYLRTGFLYERFDFNERVGVLPDALNKVAAVLALERWSEGRVGFILETRPGVYFQSRITGNAFDIPTYAVVGYKVNDSLALAVGAYGSIMGSWPVIPLAGLVWNPSPWINLNLILPDPKLNFRLARNWIFSLGGDFLGGNFRTDPSSDHRTNRAVLNFQDYRAGATVSYVPLKGLAFQLAGGWDIARINDFYHAGPRLQTNGAPYIQLRLNLDL